LFGVSESKSFGIVSSMRHDFIDSDQSDFEIDNVVYSYRDWLSRIFYVICYRLNYDTLDFEFSMFRGVKRGDDRYSSVVMRKFERLYSVGRDLVFFSYGTRGKVRGSGLHVVLEYDSNSIRLSNAWLRCGVDFNRFMTRIRKKYGRISIVRTFESHESGYPHIHVFLIFHDHVFTGYSGRDRRTGKIVYRIFGADWAFFKSCWREYGFSNIVLISSFAGGIRYLSKYLAKSTSARSAGSSGKLIRGLAMCWIFRKRSFSMSGLLFKRAGASEASASDDAIWHNGISISILTCSPVFASASSVSGSKSRAVVFNLNSRRNSDGVFVKTGVDLFGFSTYKRCSRWRLFGFCISDTAFFGDWRLHIICFADLKLDQENSFNVFCNYYDLLF